VLYGGLIALVLLAPAPEPTAAPAPAAPAAGTEPIDRTYEGPEELVPPPESEEVVTDPSAAGEVTEPEVQTETAAPVSESVTPTPVVQRKRQVPRALSTIDGYPIDEQAVIGKRRIKFYPGIQVRNQIGWVSPFTLDRYGNRYDEGGFSTGRIRWNPRLVIHKNYQFVGMLDLVNGRWAPSGSENPVIDEIIERGTPPDRTTLPIADPRELYFEARFSFGLLRIGQQGFTWGQGILANSGNYVDRFGDMRFGDDGRGDIYERILFATKPFIYRNGPIKHLAIAIGGDLVFRDERVELVKKDLAGQALLVLRWAPDDKPGNWAGGYAVYRRQKNADDGDVYDDDNDLEVGAFDVSGQGTLWLRDDLQLIGAFEGALIAGRTTLARDDEGGHTVLQGGLAGRGYVGDHDKWLVGADVGYASGDPDPNDRFLTNFVFDAGHTVGLVLFNQVGGWRSAQSEILATNGDLTAEALNGTQFLPTRGGVTNAVYAHPKFRYALWERLEFWGGPLMAIAPEPIVDPFATRLNGGVPTNSVGGDGVNNRYYGTELDVGIRGRFDIKNFWLQAGLQGGLLLPGRGIANQVGNTDGPVGGIWFRTEIRY
jgi:hypothetical protein